MKKFRVIRKDSGLKSGSREISLTKALKYPVYNPVQGKSVLPQSSEALKSGLKMSQGHLGASCSNIGRIRTKENIAVGTLLIGAMPKPLGGFLIIFESSLTFLVQLMIVSESSCNLVVTWGHGQV